ncbi:MAG: hypothetical protein J6O49_01475 [Bacteroidaceae bacterium]|nr:hypothetical protein [Bacteroidaceae bacterium]
MANVDKNQAVIDFLLTCPAIRDSYLYFNFTQAEDNNKQIITLANEKALHKHFIDGSVEKQYTFTIIDFKAVTPKPVVEGRVDENVDDMVQVQDIIDWVTEQSDNRNYPDFGEDNEVEDIRALTDNPNLNGIDSTMSPALAKYSISIQIDYLDTSKVIWNI